jgi:RNA polymerase sigma-B factor
MNEKIIPQENLVMNKVLSKLDKYDNNELFIIYSNGKNIYIRNELIERYLYIAEILSKKYANRGIEYDDLFQVASLGLIYAIERFDINRGFKFSSFATPTIIGEIKKYFRDKGWALRVPRRVQVLSKKINLTKEKLNQELQRIPTIEDIANYLKCSQEEVLEAMEASQVYSPKSLDVIFNNSKDDNNVQLRDLIGEDDKYYLLFENKDFINRMIKKLNKIENRIITDRYFNNKTQIVVANELNVSQMTISRIEKRIILKFKKEYDKINDI